MLTVGFILYPHALMSSVTLPAEMLSAADNIARTRKRKQHRLVLKIASVVRPEDAADDRVNIQANCSLEALRELDLLILPALWRNPMPVVQRHRELLPLLRETAKSDALICAVGTGSCFLAEAGLLDNRAATTHWFYMDRFAHLYPAVNTKSRHLITRSGNLYCAGSIHSVADLTGHFIEHFYGPQIARQVDAHFSPEVRRSYHDYGFFEGEVNRHHDELIVDAQQWLREHFAEKINFGEMACSLGISQRSLNRRFNQACGQSPGRYLQQLRLQHACELLRDSNLSIAAIADEVGYFDFSYFSTLFRERMAQTPSEYRKSVRGKLFSPL